MINPPFFRPPFYPSYHPNYYAPNFSKNSLSSIDNTQQKQEKKSPLETSSKEKSSRYYAFGPIRFKNPMGDNGDEPIFEILGIALYLDDIIILSLLLFLYKEGVKDEMLFLCLVLLLLS